MNNAKNIQRVLFFIVFFVGLVTAPYIGASWDEPDNIYSSGVYIDFFRKGFDRTVFDVGNGGSSYFQNKISPLDYEASHIPPVHNYVGAFLVLILEALGVDTPESVIISAFRVAGALFFGLLIAFIYKFGLLIRLPPILSLFAALSTYLYPQIFGHGYSVIKDIAQVSLFVMSLYYLSAYRLLSFRGNMVYRYLLFGSIIWGLALATKFNAVYVPVIWGLWSLLLICFRSSKDRINYTKLILADITVLILIGFTTTFVVWPYLWFATLAHVQEVILYFTNVGRGYLFAWNGIVYQTGVGKSYWWYPFGSFFLQTPLLLLGVLITGFGAAVLSRKKDSTVLLLVVWIAVPLVRIFLPGSALYDQLRHFLEILPACMLLSGKGLYRFYQSRQAVVRKTLRVFLYGTVLYMIIINTVYFPYSAGYYNLLAYNPNEHFDRDIEALSVKEGVDYLHTTYGPVTVFAPIGLHLAWYYVTSEDRYEYSPDHVDSIILINKVTHGGNHNAYYPTIEDKFRLDHIVTRGNAVFAWVYRRI